MMGKPGQEDQILNYEADTALYSGQLAKRATLTRRAVEAAQKEDEKEAPALTERMQRFAKPWWAMQIWRNSRRVPHWRSQRAEMRRPCRQLRWS